MPSYKIGLIDYINVFPFVAPYKMGALEAPGEIVFDVPANLNRSLEEGNLDASMVSSIFYIRNQDKFGLVPEFCIAAQGVVKSVCLYTKYPIHELANMTIGITPQSATSVELLKILCSQYWRIDPTFEIIEGDPTNYSAFLIIGDDSLRNPTFPNYETIDLAKAWYYATGLPFVFGVFVAKTPEAIPVVQDMLRNGLNWTEQNMDQVIEFGMKQSGLSKDIVTDYFNTLKYHMDKSKATALGRFGALSDLRLKLGTAHETVHEG